MAKKKNKNNFVRIEGYVYDVVTDSKNSSNNFGVKVTKAKPEEGKAGGQEYIGGIVKIATDEDLTNIIDVHFVYVTPKTTSGNDNQNYILLKQLADGNVPTVMKNGKENAEKWQIDGALGVNEFFVDRNGEESFVSAKQINGSFVRKIAVLNEDVDKRAYFETDIVLTGCTHVDEDEEKGRPEKVILKGAIFNFRDDLLPVEYDVFDPNAMTYFEGLEISSKNPAATKVRGRIISQTVKTLREEESAFGAPVVIESSSTSRSYEVTWAAREPYLWDDESFMLANDFAEAIQNHEIKKATLKKSYEDRKNQRTETAKQNAMNISKGGYNF